MINILIFLYLLLFISCKFSNKEFQKLNKQDSLEITNTFNCYLESGHILFQNFAEEKNKILRLDVEYIYYNSDSTKMFAITYLEFKSRSKSNYCTSQDSSTFFFYPFVGYRANSNLKWSIYFYNSQLLLSDCKKEYINKFINEKFIKEFKRTKVSLFKNNEFIEKEVGYNINEDGFWESPFWEKGGLIEDKYFFEVEITSYVSKIFKPIDEIECESSP